MILAALLLVPFAAGAIAFVARRRPVMEAANVSAFALTLLLAIVLAVRVLRDGAVTALGGFLYADAVSALVTLLTALVGLSDTLVINPPGSRHRVVSDDGCLVLVIWEQPVVFETDAEDAR